MFQLFEVGVQNQNLCMWHIEIEHIEQLYRSLHADQTRHVNLEIHVIQLLHPHCSRVPMSVYDAKG